MSISSFYYSMFFVQFGCLWALWTYIGNIKQVDLQTKTQNSPF